jgi:hypothetical protein
MKLRSVLVTTAAIAALCGIAWAADNYRISNPGGVTTTIRAIDNAGVHTPVVTVAGSVAGSPAEVVGNVASGTADSGNPVKVGGIYQSTLPTFSNLQRGNFQIGTRGSQNVTLYKVDSTQSIVGQASNADGVAASAGNDALKTGALSFLYNGVTWDRQFTCNLSAVVNVTAAATTEIVALTGGQTIRICGFSLSMSAAGTAQIVYGTGTNCATGLTALTGAMPLATGTPLSNAGGSGSSLLRGAVSNAICVAAVTGNVVGFINYAKF